MALEGRFVWYDHMTTDVEAAKEFYSSVTGWGLQDWDGGDSPYVMWTAEETPIGGVMELPAELRDRGVPPHWMAHVAVGDLDAVLQEVKTRGGAIHKPATEIPEVGRFAVVADPQGAALALFEPKEHPMPAPDRSRPGRIGWHELNTTDHASAWKFYSDLFGWKHTSSFDMGDMGDYFMFRHPEDGEENAMGGMSDVARHMNLPPHWLYYVNVPDLDAALQQVSAGGGQVLNGPMEVPGGGRIAQCQDPQGGAFALFTAP
jgi:predicted enzyme related to lactoylglutathione lyase